MISPKIWPPMSYGLGIVGNIMKWHRDLNVQWSILNTLRPLDWVIANPFYFILPNFIT